MWTRNLVALVTVAAFLVIGQTTLGEETSLRTHGDSLSTVSSRPRASIANGQVGIGGGGFQNQGFQNQGFQDPALLGGFGGSNYVYPGSIYNQNSNFNYNSSLYGGGVGGVTPYYGGGLGGNSFYGNGWNNQYQPYLGGGLGGNSFYGNGWNNQYQPYLGGSIYGCTSLNGCGNGGGGGGGYYPSLYNNVGYQQPYYGGAGNGYTTWNDIYNGIY